MEWLVVCSLLAFFCIFGFALPRPSSPIISDTTSACAVQTPDERIALKASIQKRMFNLTVNLRNIGDVAKRQPDFGIWFLNNSTAHGYNFNQPLDNKDLYALGQAGLILQNCFIPEVMNITLAEMEQQMCQSDGYVAQLFSVLGNVSKLAADFKLLTKSDNCISPGVTCTITYVMCQKIDYPSIRSDGLPFTDYQDRLRKIVNTVTSLMHYISDLDHYDYYWNKKN